MYDSNSPILDFYPKEFEGAFYKRPGASVALAKHNEISDVPQLLDILEECAGEKSEGVSLKADSSLATRVW